MDDPQAWLKFSSQLHPYSGNSLLIMLQDPLATHDADYQAFKAPARQVRRGETGIKVLAPITCREPRLDPCPTSRGRRFPLACAEVDSRQTGGIQEAT